MSASAATAQLRERQALYPPWAGADRCKQIVQLIEENLPDEITARIDDGSLAVGEVGLPQVAATTLRLPDGSFVVELHSGLMQFIYLVTRTLLGFTTEFNEGGVVRPALTRDQLVSRIADIFFDWRAGKLSTEGDLQRAAYFPLRPGQVKIAHQLAVNAEVFILAHEFGHVLIDGGGADAPPPPPPSEAESCADRLAVSIAIAAGSRLGMRMMYAGILFAVRVFSFLEHLGQGFAGPHLPPSERLGFIKRTARSMFADELNFTAGSTIALSYDELLEGVENVIKGKGHATAQTEERVRVRMWAILEERLKNHVDQARCIADLQDAVTRVDVAICEAVAETLHEWFEQPLPPSVSDPTDGRLPLMGGFLRSAIGKFPEPARMAFTAAFP